MHNASHSYNTVSVDQKWIKGHRTNLGRNAKTSDRKVTNPETAILCPTTNDLSDQ